MKKPIETDTEKGMVLETVTMRLEEEEEDDDWEETTLETLLLCVFVCSLIALIEKDYGRLNLNLSQYTSYYIVSWYKYVGTFS